MKTSALLILFLLLISPAIAHNEPHPPEEVGESIVNLEISCDDLSEEQLIAVGTYLYGDSSWVLWLKIKTIVGYCWKVEQ